MSNNSAQFPCYLMKNHFIYLSGSTHFHISHLCRFSDCSKSGGLKAASSFNGVMGGGGGGGAIASSGPHIVHQHSGDFGKLKTSDIKRGSLWRKLTILIKSGGHTMQDDVISIGIKLDNDS